MVYLKDVCVCMCVCVYVLFVIGSFTSRVGLNKQASQFR